jgi:hypothetical protein
VFVALPLDTRRRIIESMRAAVLAANAEETVQTVAWNGTTYLVGL